MGVSKVCTMRKILTNIKFTIYHKGSLIKVIAYLKDFFEFEYFRAGVLTSTRFENHI